MTRYWIGVASREHVLGGVAGGFAQVCHGKPGPLKTMAPGDYIIYYSPTEKFGQPIPCQQFTALGKVQAGEPYQVSISKDFTPWRRNVTFFPVKQVATKLLLDKLSFIRDKNRWGFIFRRGCFQIPASDFIFIASQMEITIHE